MAGTKVNNYSNIDTNIQALQLTTDKVFKGLHQLTLTEMDTTTVPAIASGSVVECNGTLIKYDSEEAIVTTDPHTSATVADGAVYVVIKGADYTVYFTATAPTWSDSKQGYYGLTTWANDRYVGNCIKATASYTYKYYIKDQEIKNTKSRARLSKTGSQTISGANNTKITFDVISFDNNSEASTANSRFTVKSSGYYRISCQLIGTPVSYTTAGSLVLYKNNSAFAYGGRIRFDSPMAGFEQFVTYNDIVYLAANDYIEMWWNQSSLGSFSTTSASDRVYFVMEKIDD